jgi:uncharacterized protein (DUF3084 family)
MDLVSSAVLIVFVILGGVIAVFADELGRRIGKKRLVLHRRIRPKTTARIITFFSGLFITILTIVVLFVVSSDVRVWLQQGSSAIKQRDRLLKEVGDLKKTRDDLEAKYQVRSVDIRNLEKSLNELKNEQKVVHAQLEQNQTKLKQSQNQVLEASRRLAQARNQSNKLNTQIVSLNRSITQKTAERDKAEKDKKEAESSVRKLNSEYAELSKHDLDLDQKLQAKEREVADKEGQIADKVKQITTADAEIKQLGIERDGLLTEIADNKQKAEDARKAYESALHGLDTALQINDLLTEHTRVRPMMFSQHEELARVTIPAGLSKDQVRFTIESAISMARDEAKKHGAKKTEKLEYADLVDLTTPNGQTLSVAAQKDILAASLAGDTEDQVLIVFSAFNAFADEGVVVGLAHQANPVVYQPGQTLAEVRIDGREDHTQILQGLNDLATKVRARALKDKMIPIQKGEFSLGVISSEDILDVYDRIKESRGSVRVRVRARRLTRAADPLLLDFEVR